ncbi:EP1-like glycoprotein 3 [Dissostichus eleginoides]|uniref:EP1-like glycoprotein 3 n=1 Tax=Dissostichus eleginoides TaxID=100907 RepID=A0AAD9FFZ1_DISEL|nr:EP1-like glycoprotein 3 [Dissostichus eleginoides]
MKHSTSVLQEPCYFSLHPFSRAETFTKPNKQSTVSNFSSPVVQDTEDLSTERDERWRGGGTDAVSPWACESGRGDGVGQVWSSPQGGSPLTLFRRGTRVPPATQYFQHTALGGCLLLPTMKPIAGVSLGRKAPWSADCYPEVFHRFLPSLPPALTQKERKNSITEQIQGEQCSLECILTRNKQCQHLWGADG